MLVQFITDMCMKLGKEMTVFLKRDVLTIEDLDLYAFTNNGPVAICLTKVCTPQEAWLSLSSRRHVAGCEWGSPGTMESHDNRPRIVVHYHDNSLSGNYMQYSRSLHVWELA